MSNGNLETATLRAILTKFAPDVDAEGDGVFDTPWRSTETFYRFTEDYIAPEKRTAYKRELEVAFPGRRAV